MKKHKAAKPHINLKLGYEPPIKYSNTERKEPTKIVPHPNANRFGSAASERNLGRTFTHMNTVNRIDEYRPSKIIVSSQCLVIVNTFEERADENESVDPSYSVVYFGHLSEPNSSENNRERGSHEG